MPKLSRNKIMRNSKQALMAKKECNRRTDQLYYDVENSWNMCLLTHSK